MSSFSTAFNDEIKRIARRELKPDVTSIRTTTTSNKHEIVALRKRVKELESMVLKLVKTQLKHGPESAAKVLTAKQTRWSAEGFAKLRKRLKVSAAQMGKILGVSSATVYHWENADSEVRPRPQNMPKILAARRLSPAKARQLLSDM